MRISLSTLAAFTGFAAFAVALAAAPNIARAQAQTTICKDGTTSATTGKGACSGHGGIDAAKTKAAAKSTKSAKSSSKSAATPPVATAASVKPATTAPPAKKEVAATKSNNDKDAAGATAQCKDGMYSHAASHSGACSKHGGVAKFLK